MRGQIPFHGHDHQISHDRLFTRRVLVWSSLLGWTGQTVSYPTSMY